MEGRPPLDATGAPARPTARPRSWARCGAVLLAASLCGATCGSGGPSASAKVERVGSDAVAFRARVSTGSFERRLLGMPGYHLVVWSHGGAAPASLFEAAVSDVAVLDALEALGARPGNGLPMASWERRDDARDPAPDRVIAGPPVEMTVRVPGRASPLTLEQLLVDPGGRGFAMRLGGHRANIPHWHSGCIVCLYSCPGSKVGNARYTVRDYVRGTTRFAVREGVLPDDGTEVTITLRLLPAAPS
jgi:hypothetical protein